MFYVSQLLFLIFQEWQIICCTIGLASGNMQRRQWHPTPVLFPGKSHGRRGLVGCSPRGRYESDTTERFHFHFSLSCIGEGNGNPLQCSCLENPRDGGAAVFGVAQSRTLLKQLSSSSSSRKYGKEFPENLVTATCSNATERDVFAQFESYWEAESDGQGVYSGPSTLYTVHLALYDSEINDVPSPGVKTLSTYPSKVVFWNVLTSHN